MRSVRPPAVAESFYPAAPAELMRQARHLLAQEAPEAASKRPLRALVVPHAAWGYSGALAARAIAEIGSRRAAARRILLLGPSHFVPFRGLALPETEAFATPLGEVPIDPDAERLLAFEQVLRWDEPHVQEHALEVVLPLLQAALGEIVLVPLAVGDATPREVAEVLAAVPAQRTLVVVSTDLSHYLSDAEASRTDLETARAVERLDWLAIGADRACGAVALRGLLAWAADLGLVARRLGLATSADAGATPERVVGYGAWAFEHDPSVRLRPPIEAAAEAERVVAAPAVGPRDS